MSQFLLLGDWYCLLLYKKGDYDATTSGICYRKSGIRLKKSGIEIQLWGIQIKELAPGIAKPLHGTATKVLASVRNMVTDEEMLPNAPPIDREWGNQQECDERLL